MASLGVNIDHVATLRQARGGSEPGILDAAMTAVAAGADAITIHLREDRRHIQDFDVRDIRDRVATRLNLEMAATEEMIDIALQIQPDCCCIVPENRQELTTEGGLDVIANQKKVAELCNRLAEANIEVSLFIDPDMRQIESARSCNTPAVEIHTGSYANATGNNRDDELAKISRAITFTQECGIRANAGHGLDYLNTQAVARLPGVAELNIGHAIIAKAVFVGLGAAVREMKNIIDEATQ